MPKPAPSPELDAAFAETGAASEAALLSGARGRSIVRPRRGPAESDIQDLIVPASEEQLAEASEHPGPELPGSIEEAVLSALDQIPRLATLPPPASDDDAKDGG